MEEEMLMITYFRACGLWVLDCSTTTRLVLSRRVAIVTGIFYLSSGFVFFILLLLLFMYILFYQALL